MGTYYMTGTRVVPPGGMKVYGSEFITNSETVTRKTHRTIQAIDSREAVAKWEQETRHKYGDGATITVNRIFIKGPADKWLELSSTCGTVKGYSASYEQYGNTYTASIICPFCEQKNGYTCTYDSPNDWEPASEERSTCQHVLSFDIDVKLTIWFVDKETD